MKFKKMTTRNTVKEIKEFLVSSSKTSAVKANKDLIARMKYTSDALSKGEKVAKKDLLDLASDCFTVMVEATEKQEKPVQPVKESSLKKKPNKKEKAEEKPAPEKKKAQPKKETKKTTKKPAEKKKEEPKFSFPKEFEDEDGVKYTLASDLTNIDELREAFANDDELVFAVHWTPAMLKYRNEEEDIGYGLGQLSKKQVPKKFDNDLDLLSVLFIGDRTDVILTVSMYTEAMYYWNNSDLKQTKTCRKAPGLDFEVYRAEDTEESES